MFSVYFFVGCTPEGGVSVRLPLGVSLVFYLFDSVLDAVAFLVEVF